MKRALIVSGGCIEEEFCRNYIENHRFDHKTAVDFGLQFFYKNNWKPDRIVGDLDSAACEAVRFFENAVDIEWIRLVPEKDDTDTEAAIRRIIAEGYDEIHILGGTGNRIDHMLGNVGLLGLGLLSDTRIWLVDEHNRVQMIRQNIKITKKEQFGKYVSLLPVTPKVTGITLTGMKYPLENYTMERFLTIGISNEIVEEEAGICFKDGILLVMETKD